MDNKIKEDEIKKQEEGELIIIGENEEFKYGYINDLKFIEFKEGNKIKFFQDHNWWEEVPYDVKFFIGRSTDSSIWLMANGYGVTENNILGLKGKYGNGQININKTCLNAEILKFIELEKTAPKKENEGIGKEIINLPNGKYNALWSGHSMEILVPEERVKVSTTMGVKGINVDTKVEIRNGLLYIKS